MLKKLLFAAVAASGASNTAALASESPFAGSFLEFGLGVNRSSLKSTTSPIKGSDKNHTLNIGDKQNLSKDKVTKRKSGLCFTAGFAQNFLVSPSFLMGYFVRASFQNKNSLPFYILENGQEKNEKNFSDAKKGKISVRNPFSLATGVSFGYQISSKMMLSTFLGVSYNPTSIKLIEKKISKNMFRPLIGVRADYALTERMLIGLSFEMEKPSKKKIEFKDVNKAITGFSNSLTLKNQSTKFMINFRHKL